MGQEYNFLCDFTEPEPDYIIKAGTYIINETPSTDYFFDFDGMSGIGLVENGVATDGAFSSNGNSYCMLIYVTLDSGATYVMTYRSSSLISMVYDTGDSSWEDTGYWADLNYRIVTFDHDVKLADFDATDLGYAVTVPAKNQYYWFVNNFTRDDSITGPAGYTIKAGTYTAMNTISWTDESLITLDTKYDGSMLIGVNALDLPFTSNATAYTSMLLLGVAEDWAYSSWLGGLYYSTGDSSVAVYGVVDTSTNEFLWKDEAYKTIEVTEDTILTPITDVEVGSPTEGMTVLPETQYKLFTSNFFPASAPVDGSTLQISANSTAGKTLYYSTPLGNFSTVITGETIVLENVLAIWFDEVPGSIERSYGCYTGSGTEADPYQLYWDAKLSCNFGYTVELVNTDAMTINYTLADGTTGSSSDISIHLDNVYSLYLSKIYPNIATFNSGTYTGTGVIDDPYILTSNIDVSFTYNFVSAPVVTGNYLAFHSDDGEFGFALDSGLTEGNSDFTFEYSTDAVTWNTAIATWEYDDIPEKLISHNGNFYLRGIGNSYLVDSNESGASSGVIRAEYNNSENIKVYAYGYVEYLLDYETVTNGNTISYSTQVSGCYNGLFYGWKGLVQPPSFYANVTTLPEYGCYCMYYNCTSLAILPTLPTVGAGNSCYDSMFYGCTNIKMSETQDDTYVNEYKIPDAGVYRMFDNTGGSFTGTPEVNTTYYTSNEVI